jgi:hypothetical protein
MANSNIETDVAIIGGGGAGIPAAIEVARAGAKALVLEGAAECGGTAAISGGGCCIVGTPLQKSQGINDTPDMAFEDWINWGGGQADEVWARYYLEHSLHDLYHWADRCGVRWVDLKFQEGNRVLRWHRPDNNGLGLMTALIKTAEAMPNITIMKSTKAGKLITKDGRVAGLTATKENQTWDIHSKTVVVATGGFNSNLDMVLEHRPEFKNFRVMEGSGFGAKGEGHTMIRELGGYFTHMDCIWFYVYATPDYRDPKQRRGLVFRMVPGYIWFNQQGRRFHNESLTGGASATPTLLAQTPPHAWAIADTPMLAKIDVADPYYRRGDVIDRTKVEELLNNSPCIKKADSLEELGQQCEFDDVKNFVTKSKNTTNASRQNWTKIPSLANHSRVRRNSTHHRIMRFRFVPWRARILAAPKPICAAARSINISSPFRDFTRLEKSPVWPAVTSMARLDWKARCSVRRSSADESPVPGRPTKPASVPALSGNQIGRS